MRLFKVAANDEISSVAKVAAAEQELDALVEDAVSNELPLGDVVDVAAPDTDVADTEIASADQE